MRRVTWRYLLALVGVLAVYVATGKLGLQLATVNASTTAVWPPTGIAIAAALLLGPRVWPALFTGALLVNLTTSGDLASSVGIALGNTLEGLLGAALATRFANGPRAFLHLATVVRFALVALVAPVASATIGVASLALSGMAPPSDLAAVWGTWWIGDVTGALIVAPLIVVWATPTPRLRHGGDRAEAVALAAATAAIVLVGFSRLSPLASRDPLGFLTYPVLAWAAFRFGPRGAASLVGALALLGVGASTFGGPVGAGDPAHALVLLQSFMAVASVTSLTLAAAVLEREVAERSRLATEERLRIAEENKVRARDEFLSIAAHELRTPLTSIQLAVQYFQREMNAARFPTNLAVARAVSAIGSQSERLGSLVGQLLDTVRVQTDRLDLLASEQDVVALVVRIADEAQAMSPRHEIVVDAPLPVSAVVDPIRIEQVVRNLIDNAVKFSPAGRIDVGVASEGDGLVIAVRDRGPGIAPVDRPRIFERFYQAQPDRAVGGLGLGLHVSRHIVERHGGAIAAEFPEGGGTRMVVKLPRGVAASAPAFAEVAS